MEARRELLHSHLVEQIGEGGMGVVWKARNTTLDRDVAIKILPDVVAEDGERLARFEREAKLLPSLNHPNIAMLLGLHDHEGTRFLSMELVEGEDLLAALIEAQPVDTGERQALAGDRAEAIRSFLVDAGGVEPARVRIMEPVAAGGVRSRLEVAEES